MKVGDIVGGVPPNLDYWWAAQIADISHAPIDQRKRLCSELGRGNILLRYFGAPAFEFSVCERDRLVNISSEDELKLFNIPASGKNRKNTIRAVEDARLLLRQRRAKQAQVPAWPPILQAEAAPGVVIDLADSETWPAELRERALTTPVACATSADCASTSGARALQTLRAAARDARSVLHLQDAPWAGLVASRAVHRRWALLQAPGGASDQAAGVTSHGAAAAGAPSAAAGPDTAGGEPAADETPIVAGADGAALCSGAARNGSGADGRSEELSKEGASAKGSASAQAEDAAQNASLVAPGPVASAARAVPAAPEGQERSQGQASGDLLPAVAWLRAAARDIKANSMDSPFRDVLASHLGARAQASHLVAQCGTSAFSGVSRTPPEAAAADAPSSGVRQSAGLEPALKRRRLTGPVAPAAAGTPADAKAAARTTSTGARQGASVSLGQGREGGTVSGGAPGATGRSPSAGPYGTVEAARAEKAATQATAPAASSFGTATQATAAAAAANDADGDEGAVPPVVATADVVGAPLDSALAAEGPLPPPRAQEASADGAGAGGATGVMSKEALPQATGDTVEATEAITAAPAPVEAAAREQRETAEPPRPPAGVPEGSTAGGAAPGDNADGAGHAQEEEDVAAAGGDAETASGPTGRAARSDGVGAGAGAVVTGLAVGATGSLEAELVEAGAAAAVRPSGLSWRPNAALLAGLSSDCGGELRLNGVAAAVDYLRQLAADPIKFAEQSQTARLDIMKRAALLRARELCFSSSFLAKKGALGTRCVKALRAADAWGSAPQDGPTDAQGLGPGAGRPQQAPSATGTESAGSLPDMRREAKRSRVVAQPPSKGQPCGPSGNVTGAGPAAVLDDRAQPPEGSFKAAGGKPAAGAAGAVTATKPAYLDDDELDMSALEYPLRPLVDISGRTAASKASRGSGGGAGGGGGSGARPARSGSGGSAQAPGGSRPGSGGSGSGLHISSLVDMKSILNNRKLAAPGSAAAARLPAAAVKSPPAAPASAGAGIGAGAGFGLGVVARPAPPPQPQEPRSGNRLLIWFGKGLPMPTGSTMEAVLDRVSDPTKRPQMEINYTSGRRYISLTFPKQLDATRFEAMLHVHGCALLKVPSMENVKTVLTRPDAEVQPPWPTAPARPQRSEQPSPPPPPPLPSQPPPPPPPAPQQQQQQQQRPPVPPMELLRGREAGRAASAKLPPRPAPPRAQPHAPPPPPPAAAMATATASPPLPSPLLLARQGAVGSYVGSYGSSHPRVESRPQATQAGAACAAMGPWPSAWQPPYGRAYGEPLGGRDEERWRVGNPHELGGPSMPHLYSPTRAVEEQPPPQLYSPTRAQEGQPQLYSPTRAEEEQEQRWREQQQQTQTQAMPLDPRSRPQPQPHSPLPLPVHGPHPTRARAVGNWDYAGPSGGVRGALGAPVGQPQQQQQQQCDRWQRAPTPPGHEGGPSAPHPSEGSSFARKSSVADGTQGSESVGAGPPPRERKRGPERERERERESGRERERELNREQARERERMRSRSRSRSTSREREARRSDVGPSDRGRAQGTVAGGSGRDGEREHLPRPSHSRSMSPGSAAGLAGCPREKGEHRGGPRAPKANGRARDRDHGDRGREGEREQERKRDRGKDKDRDKDRGLERDKDRGLERDKDRDSGRSRSNNRGGSREARLEEERERGKQGQRDNDRERDRDLERRRVYGSSADYRADRPRMDRRRSPPGPPSSSDRERSRSGSPSSRSTRGGGGDGSAQAAPAAAPQEQLSGSSAHRWGESTAAAPPQRRPSGSSGSGGGGGGRHEGTAGRHEGTAGTSASTGAGTGPGVAPGLQPSGDNPPMAPLHVGSSGVLPFVAQPGEAYVLVPMRAFQQGVLQPQAMLAGAAIPGAATGQVLSGGGAAPVPLSLAMPMLMAMGAPQNLPAQPQPQPQGRAPSEGREGSSEDQGDAGATAGVGPAAPVTGAATAPAGIYFVPMMAAAAATASTAATATAATATAATATVMAAMPPTAVAPLPPVGPPRGAAEAVASAMAAVRVPAALPDSTALPAAPDGPPTAAPTASESRPVVQTGSAAQVQPTEPQQPDQPLHQTGLRASLDAGAAPGDDVPAAAAGAESSLAAQAGPVEQAEGSGGDAMVGAAPSAAAVAPEAPEAVALATPAAVPYSPDRQRIGALLDNLPTEQLVAIMQFSGVQVADTSPPHADQ